MARQLLAALVLALCIVVASSADIVTCPTVWECVSTAGSSCTDTDVIVRACSSPLSSYSTYNISSGTLDCVCMENTRPQPQPEPEPDVVLGSVCTREDDDGQGGAICKANPIAGQNTLRWYSAKKMGDQCSGTYDCFPPRTCVNSKCSSNLAAGDVCYNETYSSSRVALGYCPVTHYCPTYSSSGSFLSVSTCVQRRSEGDSCYFALTNPCVPPATCVVERGAGGNGKCVVPAVYFLDGGAAYNETNQCKSGRGNYTGDGFVCVDYDLVANAVNAKKGQDCTTNDDCGNPIGFSNARCRCTGRGRENKAVCSGNTWDSPAERLAELNGERSRSMTAYAAGCEENSVPPHGADRNNHAVWCWYKERLADPDDFDVDCASAREDLALGVKDCYGIYSLFCGAFSTMQMSSGMIIALVVASIFGAL